jgi:Fur family ferric uptake transcriptional regulator
VPKNSLTAEVTQKLHTRGFRLTPQRHLILETIRQADDHVTPDQIYARVHARNPAISRATIYRTLEFLCEMKLAVALQWGGQTYYEFAGETPHHHLICRNCGDIVQIDHSLIDLLTENIYRKHHFKVDMDHIALFGLCEDCRRKENRSKS